MQKIDVEFKPIWHAAFPYQDARNDKGHAFVVTNYAQQLCRDIGCNSKVVVPAAILHDIGWSQLASVERMLIFDKSVPADKRLQLRHRHQDESVKLAEIILRELNYQTHLIPEILEIISQHDTREGFISDNEGAMRDADKLWRFDAYGFLNDNQNSNITFKEHLARLAESLHTSHFFYFEYSKRLASKNLEQLRANFHD